MGQGKQFPASCGDRRNSPSSRPWRAGYSKMTFEKFLFVTMCAYPSIELSTNTMSNFLLNKCVVNKKYNCYS